MRRKGLSSGDALAGLLRPEGPLSIAYLSRIVKAGARLTSAAAAPSRQSDNVILLLPLSQHEQPASDRRLCREPDLHIGNAPVVYIDSARLDEPAGVALRRGEPHTRNQIDNPDPIYEFTRGNVG